MIDPASLRRLEAMDIQLWQVRGRTVPTSAESTLEVPPRSGRIRLEAGSGRWLLVVDDIERAQHAVLLEDIRATLGTGECRFGTWSDSPESGVAVSDWHAHGIGNALVFAEGPDEAGQLLYAGRLETLATSGQARKALWHKLKPLLEV